MNKPTLETLQEIDLSPLEHYLAPQRISEGFFTRPAGVEHYRLLAWISMQFSGVTITEIGTLDGMGLTALCYNPENKVVSWDIKDCSWKGQVPPNGQRKIVYDTYMDEVMQSSVIFYDGAHEGKDEQVFLQFLIEAGWKGIIFWDDIHLNKEMEEFWGGVLLASKMPQLKEYTMEAQDWTDIGHACGTGVTILK